MPALIILYFLVAVPIGTFAEEEPVIWKTFNGNGNLFTVRYPSNWVPASILEEDKQGHVDQTFQSISGDASIQLVQNDEKSSFSTAHELIQSAMEPFRNSSLSPERDFEIKRPIECSKYTFNRQNACSFIYELRELWSFEGERIDFNQIGMLVEALASDGTEYKAHFVSHDTDSFRQFLPSAERIIQSFQANSNASNTNNSSIMDEMAQDGPVNWKIFQNHKGLFTVMYPSNWVPEDDSDAIPPLNLMIKYPAKSIDDPEAYLYVTDYKEDYVNGSRDLLNRVLNYYNDTTDNFNVTKSVECQKYTISGIAACSAIASYTELAEPMTSLYVMGADVYSDSEYLMQFAARNATLFDHFFPTVEYMIRSFRIK